MHVTNTSSPTATPYSHTYHASKHAAIYLSMLVPRALYWTASQLYAAASNCLSRSATYTKADHLKKVDAVHAQFLQIAKPGQTIALGGKTTTHLFRPRPERGPRLNLGHLNHVIEIDVANKIAFVEGMTSMYDLVAATMKHKLLPQVVPELGGITVGGAIAGLAVESSSFKYGLFHRSVQEMTVLIGTGDVITCSRESNSDLFYAMPNALGSLGYVLSAKIQLIQAAPYVKLTHLHFTTPHQFFTALAEKCADKESFDFIDGAIFQPERYSFNLTLTLGAFVQAVPYTNSYRSKGVYYESMKARDEDYLKTEDYIWRWDADCFWTSPSLLRNSLVRRFIPDRLFKSVYMITAGRLIGEFEKNVIAPFRRGGGNEWESIIQDVGIPINECSNFIHFIDVRLGIFPLFVCPIASPDKSERYPLWDLNNGDLACDIGIFGGRRRDAHQGSFNRLLEERVMSCGGRKSLYSRCSLTKEEVDREYGGAEYDLLKRKFDPNGVFPTLYEKVSGKKPT